MNVGSKRVYEIAPLWPGEKRQTGSCFLCFVFLAQSEENLQLSECTVLVAFQGHTHRFPAGIAQQTLNSPKCGEKGIEMDKLILAGIKKCGTSNLASRPSAPPMM